MAKVKPLRIVTIYENESLLRTPSKEVTLEEIKSEKFQNFIEQLFETIRTAKVNEGWEAAGMSAVQVGQLKSVFAARTANRKGIQEYINPKLKPVGTSTQEDIEGCFSIPDKVGDVKRYKKVKLTYLDRNGNKKKEIFKGDMARVIQHEYDHLQGILFTDRIE